MVKGHNMNNAKLIDLTAEMKKEQDPKEKKVSRLDGWVNLITSIGTNNDKRMASKPIWNLRSPQEYEEFYSSDELASRIVNLVPEEALRKWVEFTGYPKDILKKVEQRVQDLDLRSATEKTWKWGRAYGGACLYIVTDCIDPSRPLRKEEHVIGLRDLSRYDLRILTTDVEADFGSPNWGHPKIYYLVVQMGSEFKGYPIHWTRMVRFDGYIVPRRTYITNNYWHDSILNRLYNPIRNYQTANDAAASILQDFNIGVYKMKGLANLMQRGQEKVVKARIDMINYCKSVARSVILDADDEDFVDVSRSVQGLPELLEKQANRLVAATEYTHTKLLGESPDGSNATGNSTTGQWFDYVQSEQENYLRPKIKRLIDVIFPDMPELDFKFKSLYQLTELEEAQLRSTQSTTDKNYIDAGVLDPTEVCESRFGGDKYSVETKLNQEARKMGLIGAHSAQAPDLLDPNPPNMLNSSEQTGLPASGIDTPSDPTTPSISEQVKPSLVPTPPAPTMPMPSMTPEPQAEQPLPRSLQPFTPNPNGLEIDRPGTRHELWNEEIDLPEKQQPFISQMMSEPMRDPKTDPYVKKGGVPSTQGENRGPRE
jgi:phage-related protein (TIGR01555 family)